MIKTDDFVGGHGLACGKFLSDEELNLLHQLVNATLCLAAGCKITASKAVDVFSLSLREQLLGAFKLESDGFHGLGVGEPSWRLMQTLCSKSTRKARAFGWNPQKSPVFVVGANSHQNGQASVLNASQASTHAPKHSSGSD